MTIDERIEALTMNLELLSHEVSGLRKAAEATERAVATLAKTVELDHARLEQDHVLLERLANIAIAHDERIEDHQARLDRIEGPRT